MSHTGWIGVDLDGTLAEYDGWKGAAHIGEPVPAMVERVKRWLAEGREVRIFTARVGPQPPDFDVEEQVRVIWRWLNKQGLPALPVTSQKDFSMVELWDDRCVQVVPNTGHRADGQSSTGDGFTVGVHIAAELMEQSFTSPEAVNRVLDLYVRDVRRLLMREAETWRARHTRAHDHG